MNETAQEIWDQLRLRFVFPLDRVDQWPDAPRGEEAGPFLERLAGEGWLTPFQCDEISEGRLDQLLLGNYRLQRELEHGLQGKVYLGEHLFLRQPVVVRILSGGPSLQRKGMANWLHQVAAVARWGHPIIVGVIDAGAISPTSDSALRRTPADANPRLYFISPFVEGEDLRQRVRQQGPLPVEQACGMLYQVARALGEAHARNLAHGFLGPSSVIRTPEGNVKIVDFGVKIWPREAYASVDAASPERPALPEPGATQGDLMGMAHCLYWALAGQAFDSQKTGILPEAPLRSLRPEIPAPLDELLLSLLQEGKKQEWTFKRVQEALLPFVGTHPASASESSAGMAYPATLIIPPSAGAAVRARPLTPLLPPEKPGRSLLIVDDEPSIRTLCRLSLERYGIQCDEAANGVLALKAFANHSYDLVLLDIDMPEMDGLEVCRRLRLIPERPHLKIVLFSGRVEGDELAPMLLTGADDFLTKPFSPIQLQNRVQAALRMKQVQERSDVLMRDLLALNRQMEDHLQARDSDLVEARNALVLGLAKLAEYRDNDTGMHLNRLQVFSRRLAEKAIKHPAFAGQMDCNYIDLLACCAPLHDIGKVGLPDYILLKPTKLDAEERRHMETHTLIGAQTLRKIAEEHGFALAFLQMAIDIARHHHERFDGTGYPDRLSGEAIPLSARIVAVCDVYDALRSRRVYKPALAHATVVELVRQGMGGHFDPALIQCFDQCQEDFARMYEEHKD